MLLLIWLKQWSKLAINYGVNNIYSLILTIKSSQGQKERLVMPL